MKKVFLSGALAVFFLMLALPGMAKVKIGGIVFTDFYYLDRSAANAEFSGVGNDPYAVTTVQVPDITRLYATWTNEDNVGMYIELGMGQEDGEIDLNQSNDVTLRHAYGWWQVTPGFRLMAGKSTTPFSPLNPSQLLGTRSGSLNIVGVGYGNFYSGRFAQLRGTYQFCKNARMALALVDPNGSARYIGAYGPWSDFAIIAQNNTKIPRIDISLPFYVGPVYFYPSFMYQHRTVDIIGTGGGSVDNDLDSYIGSLGFRFGMGPVSFVGEGNWGKNWGNTRGLIGNSLPAIISSAMLDPFTNRIDDADTYSYWFDLSYRFGVITPHLVFGEMSTSNKYLGFDLDSKSRMWGFSVPIDLAKGFRIRPEVMWYDDGELKIENVGNLDNGKYAIYGVQFQVTF
jgi:hypothetical protein